MSVELTVLEQLLSPMLSLRFETGTRQWLRYGKYQLSPETIVDVLQHPGQHGMHTVEMSCRETSYIYTYHLYPQPRLWDLG